ncbi:MAG: polyprenyl synthetase family protein [Candidatus Micrarchaeia archaeon]
MQDIDIEEFLNSNSLKVNDAISSYLKRTATKHYLEKILGKTSYDYDELAFEKGIINPLWYFLDLGGKRWRPTLMLLFIKALGKNPEKFLELSTVIELIHNATLVHDDIEDNSLTRRGSPAVHVKYGIDIATNLGDFMMFFSLHMLLSEKKLSLDVKDKLIKSYLSNMVRVTIGQATDITWHAGLSKPEEITESKYLEMSKNKTGVLARLAGEFAGILSEADEKTTNALGDFGAAIGIAFQIQDDILNIDESKVSESKGGVGDDISEGKITLIVIRTISIASKEDKELLLKILSEHTKDKKRILEAISIINKYDSISYSKKIAEKIVSEALNKLELLLKNSEAKEILKKFVEFMIKRSK